MIRKLVLFIIIFSFMPVSLMAKGPSPHVSTKPSSPLTLSITENTTATSDVTSTPGGAVELLITLSSQIDASEVIINIQPTGGAELIDTPLRFSTSVTAGGSVSRVIIARASMDNKSSIRVTASLKGKGGLSFFSASASYDLNQSEIMSEDLRQQKPVRMNSLGEEVIEYRAK